MHSSFLAPTLPDNYTLSLALPLSRTLGRSGASMSSRSGSGKVAPNGRKRATCSKNTTPCLGTSAMANRGEGRNDRANQCGAGNVLWMRIP